MLWLVVLVITSQADAGATFATRMRQPALREAAACEALKADGDEPCVVSDVLESIDAKRAPVFVVFFHHDWQADAGRLTGHFELFDGSGTHLRWYANANMLNDGDAILRPSRGPLLIAQVLPTQPERGASTIQSLHVTSVAAPTVPMLNLAVGPPTSESVALRTMPAVPGKLECHGDVCVQTGTLKWTETAPAFSWDWRASCAEECRVEIGPRVVLRAGKPAAVFRWKPSASAVQGPTGSADGGFLRYELRAETQALESFIVGHGEPLSAPGEHSHVCSSP
jgi:hypothetical protein